MNTKVEKSLKVILLLVIIVLTAKKLYINQQWLPGNPVKYIVFGKSLIKELGIKNSKLDSSGCEQAESCHSGNKQEETSSVILPKSFDLDIPFTSQAPLGDWGFPFDHACEEASILMVHYYLEGKSVSPSEVAEDIRDMVNFEARTFGFFEDTSAEQTAQLIRDYYGYRVKVEYDVSPQDIKEKLVQGNPLIVPTAGRLLGNPYFTHPGPVYHMLVIKGYSKNGFITNDPGTRRGADFVYSYSVLEKAISDWTQETGLTGRAAMIVVYPAE